MNNTYLAIAALSLALAACSNVSTKDGNKPSSTETKSTTPTAEIATRPFPDQSFYDLLVAEFAVRRSDYDLALGNYLKQAHQTRDAGVTTRATHLAQFLNADKAALDASQLWVELEPDNLEAQYTSATMLAKNQRPMEALHHMALVLENNGSTNFAAIAASALPLPEPTRNELEGGYDALLLQYPDNTQLMISKALLLQQRDETEQALDIIRKVIKQDPDDLHAVVVEARLLQQLGRPEEALSRLKQSVDQHPDNRRLRLQYARILMTTDIALAREQFEILIREIPNDPDLLLSLAIINKESGHIAEAELYFQRLLATGQRTTEAHYYLGQIAAEQQQWSLALDHYQQIPMGPDFIAASNRIVAIYLQQGELDKARHYLSQLRQQYPEQGVTFYLLEAQALMSQGQDDTAHQLLSEALLAYPGHEDLLYTRSMLSEKRGDYRLMEQDLAYIIKQNPNNATAINALGYVLANQNQRLDEAYTLINRAITLKPGDPAILDSLGWVNYRLGKLEPALGYLQQAYAIFPDPEVAAHLGEVLWQTGQHEQARIIWRQGLQREPDNAIILEAMQRLTDSNNAASKP